MSAIQIFNTDCIPGMAEHLEADSVHLVVTSIPFGALFQYSAKTEDIGNNVDGVDLRADGFGLHMRFFAEQLFRVMKPGCNVCIHVQQLLRYKNQHGYSGRRDFRGAVIDLFGAAGFEYKGEVAIEKNPQLIARRLQLQSLQFKTGRTNARDLAPAVNDYVLVFQKPGESHPVPALRHTEENPGGWVTAEEWIAWARGVWRNTDLELNRPVEFDDEGEPTRYAKMTVPGLAASFPENFDLQGFAEALRWSVQHEWLATGMWSDIQETDVLDGWKSARDTDDEKHVCPLQLEVIRRLVKLYTNPGEVVLDPFMGIGSTAVICEEQGRDAVGFELKESYHAQAEGNVKLWRERKRQPAQLALLDEEPAAEEAAFSLPE